MFLVDDILLAPFNGLMWVCKEVHDAARQELAREGDVIMEELRELYLMLESGRLSAAEFNVREKSLLDRLELLPERPALI
jgi:hypothetical protein